MSTIREIQRKILLNEYIEKLVTEWHADMDTTARELELKHGIDPKRSYTLAVEFYMSAASTFQDGVKRCFKAQGIDYEEGPFTSLKQAKV